MNGSVEDQSQQVPNIPVDNNCKPTQHKKLSTSDIDSLLLENSQILAQLSMEGKIRRNRNIINTRMCILINRLERNLIRIAKNVSPACVGDPQYLESEKNRFINFYKNRNGSRR